MQRWTCRHAVFHESWGGKVNTLLLISSGSLASRPRLLPRSSSRLRLLLFPHPPTQHTRQSTKPVSFTVSTLRNSPTLQRTSQAALPRAGTRGTRTSYLGARWRCGRGFPLPRGCPHGCRCPRGCPRGCPRLVASRRETARPHRRHHPPTLLAYLRRRCSLTPRLFLGG